MARQARYVVQKAPGIDGPPIPADEPCIVIRAQDVLALAMLDAYVGLYGAVQLVTGKGDDQVVDELEQHRRAIEDWQRDHPTKVADR
jgi:hypothetical protein